MNFNGYANKDIDEVFKSLGTSRRGLSEDEAEKRLKTAAEINDPDWRAEAFSLIAGALAQALRSN